MFRITGLAVLACGFCSSAAVAAEGSSLAGPIGGTDIRSAFLPPPGLYGGAIYVRGGAHNFTDGSGNEIPALDGLNLHQDFGAGFLLYVPPVQVFGGSIGVAGVLVGGENCGRLVDAAPKHCNTGAGDPYVELQWSRFFGKVRPSSDPTAYPIAEGLAIEFGVGAIIPVGSYGAEEARTQGTTLGSNIWDIAPLAALTYTTAPVLADGTEFSAKVYWNNYLENPETNYKTGDLVNIDFALTEHAGHWQIGLAGAYFEQIEDDSAGGIRVPPDGRQNKTLALGAVAAYDIPELGATIRLKALKSVYTENFVESYGIAVMYVMKLR
jgi:hypothetical protein